MKVVFLTGHRKSGTTLLHALFDGHPEMNIYPVDLCLLYGFLPCQINRLSKKEQLPRIEDVIRKSTLSIEGKKISKSNKIYKCEDFIEHLKSKANLRDFSTPNKIISTISNLWCSFFDLNTDFPFVIKETSQSIYALEIQKAFPDIKFIQIIRDPRDNYAALKTGVKKYYSALGEDEMETLASLLHRSRMDMLAGIKLQEENPNIYTSIRFEDLTKNVEVEMMRIASYCEVSFDRSMLRPTFLSDDYFGNNHDGVIFTGVSKNHVNKWSERITESETGIIEFWMSDVMKNWGYPLSLSNEVSINAYARFYNWINCRYFYRDSFGETKI